MKKFVTFLFVFLLSFLSHKKERMSKEQYRAAQKLFLLEKLNLDPDSEKNLPQSISKLKKNLNKMMSYRK